MIPRSLVFMTCSFVVGVLIFVRTPLHADNSSSIPKIDEWRWYNDDFRFQLGTAHWTPASWPALIALDVNGQKVSAIEAEGSVTRASDCLRREPGSPPHCIVLQIRNGENKSVVSDVYELRSMLGSIDTERRAVALASVVTPCLRYQGDALDGWVTYSMGEYFVIAYRCQPLMGIYDATSGVLLRVPRDGIIHEIANEPYKRSE